MSSIFFLRFGFGECSYALKGKWSESRYECRSGGGQCYTQHGSCGAYQASSRLCRGLDLVLEAKLTTAWLVISRVASTPGKAISDSIP